MSSLFANQFGAAQVFWRPMQRFLPLLTLLGTLGAAPQLAAALPADAPRISVADATIAEGNTGFRDLSFVASIPKPVAYEVTVKAQTIDMTARAGTDYTASTGNRVIIRAGETSGLLKIRISTDKIEERDEQFRIRLYDATNATLLDGDALGTVLDDDYAGQISINDISFVEQNSGQKVAKSLVRFSRPALHDISVRYETKSGTAKAGSDFVDTKGTLLFKPGRVALDVLVPVVGDTVPEEDETFAVNLLVAGYVPQKGSGAVKIVNDDGPIPIELVVSDFQLSEDVNSLGFYVGLSHAPKTSFDVAYETQDGTAQAGSDYEAKRGVLRFGPNQTQDFVRLSISNDRIEESDESFGFKLTPPAGITGDLESVIFINDDDYAGQISVSSVSLPEGNSGQKPATIRVSLSQAPLHPVVVRCLTGIASAMEGSDFITTDSTFTVTPTGGLMISLAVPIVGDTMVEDDEALKVSVFSGRTKNAEGIAASGVGIITIINDDGVVPPVTGVSGKIAFVSSRADGDGHIYVMNADGTSQIRLTQTGRNYGPRFSREGQKIVFLSDRSLGTSGGFDIFTMNADGSGETRLTSDASHSRNYYSASYSPDGQKILFMLQNGDTSASNPVFTTDFYLMGADGSSPTKINIAGREERGAEFARISAPAFSPDGSRIAFRASVGGVPKIYEMGADGSNPTLLADRGYSGSGSYYSPDGRQITFTMYADGGEQIWKMNADGSGQIALTNRASSRDGYGPCFSPDGQKIAYTATIYAPNRSRVVQIWVMNADGSGQVAVTHGGPNDYDREPSWAPGSVNPPAASPAAPPAARPNPSGGNS